MKAITKSQGVQSWKWTWQNWPCWAPINSNRRSIYWKTFSSETSVQGLVINGRWRKVMRRYRLTQPCFSVGISGYKAFRSFFQLSVPNHSNLIETYMLVKSDQLPKFRVEHIVFKTSLFFQLATQTIPQPQRKFATDLRNRQSQCFFVVIRVSFGWGSVIEAHVTKQSRHHLNQ